MNESVVNINENDPLLKKKKKDPKAKARRALTAAVVLTTIFMVGEVYGGYEAGSLAIMTDAAHLMTDIGAMLLSLFSMWLASRPPTAGMSFGFHRAEILGALASVLTIWALTGILVYEAINRIIEPQDVDGKIMFIVACGGLVINILDAFILHAGSVEHSHGGGGHGHSHGGGGHGHSHGDKKKKKEKKKIDLLHPPSAEPQESHSHGHGGGDHGHSHGDKKKKKKKENITNINVYSAFIHVIGDCVQSLGVMAASGLIWWKPSWRLADPIVTFIFSLIVLVTTVRLLRQSISVLMEGVPQGIEAAEVQKDLEEITGVHEIHDLHIWSITVGQPALSVHLIVRDESVNTDHVLAEANTLLKENYNIVHTTIQIERKDNISCENMEFHSSNTKH